MDKEQLENMLTKTERLIDEVTDALSSLQYILVKAQRDADAIDSTLKLIEEIHELQRFKIGNQVSES